MLSFRKEKSDLNTCQFIVGVDEAGRGPLAGPVVSGSFCFLKWCLAGSTVEEDNEEEWIERINDSKKITEQNREEIYSCVQASERGLLIDSQEAENIREGFRPDFVYAKGAKSEEEIDLINILEATMEAMVDACGKIIDYIWQHYGKDQQIKVLIDGNRIPAGFKTRYKDNSKLSCEAIVKGDASVLSIAAASIVAKCVRDKLMRDLGLQFPEFGLAEHKGYPTATHKALVATLGPTRIHRLSFEPCYTLLKTGKWPVPEKRRFDEIVRIKEEQKERRKSKKRIIVDSKLPANQRTLTNLVKISPDTTPSASTCVVVDDDDGGTKAPIAKRRRQSGLGAMISTDCGQVAADG